MEKRQITDPPKVWVSSFLSVNGNRISALAIIKKNIVDRNGISVDTGDAIFFFLNFALVHFPPSAILGCISTFMRGYT